MIFLLQLSLSLSSSPERWHHTTTMLGSRDANKLKKPSCSPQLVRKPGKYSKHSTFSLNQNSRSIEQITQHTRNNYNIVERTHIMRRPCFHSVPQPLLGQMIKTIQHKWWFLGGCREFTSSDVWWVYRWAWKCRPLQLDCIIFWSQKWKVGTVKCQTHPPLWGRECICIWSVFTWWQAWCTCQTHPPRR